MTEAKQSKKERELEHKYRIMAEARLNLAYWELAKQAADDGLLNLYNEFKELAEVRQSNMEDLKKKRIR